jgi:hypothetical protein
MRVGLTSTFKWAALAATAWLAAAAAIAGQVDSVKGRASGTFASRGTSFEVADAFAFRTSSSTGERPVIAVAVSNAGFEDDFIGRYRDRRYLLDNYFRDDETALVYFEFSPAGDYQGLSYSLGPGNGCAYCSGGVVSTVRLAGGRLAGHLGASDAGNGRSFSIEMDVPVASDEFGASQGAGGGAPGAAYLGYHAAVVAGDALALAPRIAGGMAEKLERAERNGQLADFFAWLQSEHPARVRVTEAFVRGDRALVLTAGESGEGAVTSEVVLGRVDGAWRVEDEMVRPGKE